jgi:hypothetical protein
MFMGTIHRGLYDGNPIPSADVDDRGRPGVLPDAQECPSRYGSAQRASPGRFATPICLGQSLRSEFWITKTALPVEAIRFDGQYQNTINKIIRDKSHSKTPLHSIVAEIANAMTSPGHSGRRGISSATGPVSSAWLRSRTVMSMEILAPPNELTHRYDLKSGAPVQDEIVLVRIDETVFSHKFCQKRNWMLPCRRDADAIYARCCRWASLLDQASVYA